MISLMQCYNHIAVLMANVPLNAEVLGEHQSARRLAEALTGPTLM